MATITLHRTYSFLSLLIACLLTIGCGEDTSTDGAPSAPSEEITTVSAGPEIPDEAVCAQEYSVCGYIRIPYGFEGNPRSIAIGLYREPTPAGSPDIVLAQIEDPSITPGELYPIRVHPVLDPGDFHIWAFIYVEGGGTNRPVNGTDYMGSTGLSLTFDGQPLEFQTVDIDYASGW